MAGVVAEPGQEFDNTQYLWRLDMCDIDENLFQKNYPIISRKKITSLHYIYPYDPKVYLEELMAKPSVLQL